MKASGNGGIVGTKTSRGSVPDHGWKIFELASNTGLGEASIPQPDVKGLDRVGNSASV